MKARLEGCPARDAGYTSLREFSADNHVIVPVAAGPVGDGQAIRHALHQIGPGGMTNLSDGLIRGIQEAIRVAGERSSPSSCYPTDTPTTVSWTIRRSRRSPAPH